MVRLQFAKRLQLQGRQLARTRGHGVLLLPALVLCSQLLHQQLARALLQVLQGERCSAGRAGQLEVGALPWWQGLLLVQVVTAWQRIAAAGSTSEQ
jgi:hypothetical protein